jgi:hypothetical protein
MFKINKKRKNKKMTMREAFDIYFAGRIEEYKRTRGHYPKNEGFSEWHPVLQTEPVDFKSLEKEFDFEIHPHLKGLFSTYWFKAVSGYFEGEEYYINPIPLNIDIPMHIKRLRQDGDIDYLNGVFFELGDAETDCGLYVNNDNGEVICVDWNKARHYDFQVPFAETSFKVANSLVELISNLKY